MIGAGVRTSAGSWELSAGCCSGAAGMWPARWKQFCMRLCQKLSHVSRDCCVQSGWQLQSVLLPFPADVHTFNALIAAVPQLKDRFLERWELAKVRR